MRVRVKYNIWLKELLKDKHFPIVANLGCCEDGDCIVNGKYSHSKGSRYMNYFTYDKVYHVDLIDYSAHYQYDNEIFLQENIEQTSIPKHSIDFIFCGWAIYHTNTSKTLKEIKRILKPNGKFLISYWGGVPKRNKHHFRFQKIIEPSINILEEVTWKLTKVEDNRIGIGRAIYGELK